MKIIAYFKNHEPVEMMAVETTLFLLKTDPQVKYVLSAETGEIIIDK